MFFKVKDEEYKKLAAENAELRRITAALKEQLVELVVHNVRQHFCGVNVVDNDLVEQTSGNANIPQGGCSNR